MTRPLKPNPKLLALWRGLDPTQRRMFARYAKTTVGSLRQQAEGRRGISPDLAIRIEKAADRMAIDPPISRASLSETCGKCEYARACLKLKRLT